MAELTFCHPPSGSLYGNRLGPVGAARVADALKSNSSLRELKYALATTFLPYLASSLMRLAIKRQHPMTNTMRSHQRLYVLDCCARAWQLGVQRPQSGGRQARRGGHQDECECAAI